MANENNNNNSNTGMMIIGLGVLVVGGTLAYLMYKASKKSDDGTIPSCSEGQIVPIQYCPNMIDIQKYQECINGGWQTLDNECPDDGEVDPPVNQYLISVDSIYNVDWIGEDECDTTVTITNNSGSLKEFEVEMQTLSGDKIDIEPDGYWANCENGETIDIKVSTTASFGISIEDLYADCGFYIIVRAFPGTVIYKKKHIAPTQ